MRSPVANLAKASQPVVNLRQAVMSCCVALAACTPISPTPPFHFAETARVLDSGRVSATVAGGVGSFETIGGGVGLGARVRMGVGGDQEVGGDVTAIGRVNDDEPTTERPWLGKSTATAAKLAWKIAVAPWLAFSAGGGFSHSVTGNALGGDVAAIVSTPGTYASFRPYGGVRGALAVPAGRASDEAGGITKAIIVAAGTEYELGEHFHLLFELAFMGESNRGYFSTDADPNREVQTASHPGWYSALAGAYYF